MSDLHELREQFLLQAWYLIAVELLAVYLTFTNLHLYLVRKKLGATNAPWKGDNFFGFKVVRDLMHQRSIGRQPDYFMDRFRQTNVTTMMLKLAGKTVLSTRDPENIKAILATQFNDFALGTRHRGAEITLGDGIFTLDGAGWKHSRAMLRPQFAREQVGQVESLEHHVKDLITNIRKTGGQKFDIQPLFFKLTIDSGTGFLFGESCDSLREDDPTYVSESDIDSHVRKEFPKCFNYAQDMLNVRLSLQLLYFMANNAEFRRSNKIIHAFTDFYVHKALNASEEEFEKQSRGGYVFLYELAKQTRNPKVLRDQCLNILLAARDTTAGLLSFAMFELARNPAIFAKLREEIVDTFGEGEDADLLQVTFESLKKCEYLKWVINETLRMYPSVPQNFRVSTRHTTLPRGGGPDASQPVFLPKGTPVSYSVFTMHRDEAHYGDDASVYRPERWGEPLAKKLGWAFLPFNGGPRICLGQQFALTEASYTIVRLLQTFKNIESFDTVYPPAKATHLTMSLFEGANISLS